MLTATQEAIRRVQTAIRQAPIKQRNWGPFRILFPEVTVPVLANAAIKEIVAYLDELPDEDLRSELHALKKECELL